MLGNAVEKEVVGNAGERSGEKVNVMKEKEREGMESCENGENAF